MIIKKFVGKNEEEATAAARKALGEKAVVMNVRDLRRKGLVGFFMKPQVEVTAAIEEMTDTVVANDNPPDIPSSLKGVQNMREQRTVQKNPEEDRENPDEKDESVIEEKLESLHSLIEQQMKQKMETAGETPEIEHGEEKKENDEVERFLTLICDTLEDNEVSGKYARSLAEEVEKLKKPGISIDFMLSSIYQKLVLKFGETRTIEKTGDGPEVVFFIGPTGVGKTTTIAKIASKFCVSDRAKVALLTTDTYRVKAAEQLRTYADILNVPFRIIYELDDLDNALDEFEDFDYILVDTAGHSPKNDEQIESQKQFVEMAMEDFNVQVYLVLSVTTKYRDLINIVDKYSYANQYRLIFTKLDETTALGNMLNLRLYTGADVSYITNGQDVPDDISEFNAQKIVRSLLETKS
ncbi:MAG: flagellar biosynthesis protein FlhF [Lachnospiraceae bacterium]|nr:flagellar biosynthesis protein FlhF [Lachnospiraceae bacterium]